MSQVVNAARHFKADLARREAISMRAMATQYAGVVRSLERSIDEVAAAMAAQKAAGKAVTLTSLYRDERYRTLLAQAQGEFARYENTTANLITSERAAFARLGASQAVDLLDIMHPGISSQFNRLPTIAIQNMAGFLSDSAPLHKLLKDAWPAAIKETSSALVEGIALGYGPKKIAKMMRDAIGGGLKRSLVISRTETLRSYRTASLETYRGYGPDVVRGYQRLADHSVRTCPLCLALDGKFYKLSSEFASHPNCRCTMVPVLKDAPLHQWKYGPEWLADQSADRQRTILGPGRYDAWKAGLFDLRDAVRIVPNRTWGPSVRVVPLRELV